MIQKRPHVRRYKRAYEINGKTKAELKRIAWHAMVTAFGSEEKAREWVQWLAEGGKVENIC